MNMLKNNSFLKKVISIVLITTFIALDISWSYPFQPSSQNYKLARQVISQKEMMDDTSKAFQEAFFNDYGLIYCVQSVGRLLLGYPSKDIPTVSAARLHEVMAKMNFDEKDLPGLDLSEVTLTNGVVSIPYVRDDRKYTIQIVRKDSPRVANVRGIGRDYKISSITGFESNNYITSIFPEGFVQPRQVSRDRKDQKTNPNAPDKPIETGHAEDVQTSEEEPHDFEAISGERAGFLTVAAYLVGTAVLFWRAGFTSETILVAGLFGAYLGWAAIRYFRVGKNTYKALEEHYRENPNFSEYGMTQGSPTSRQLKRIAIARSDGYRHPAFDRLSLRDQRIINKHESPTSHIIGMLGILPIVSIFVQPEQVEERRKDSLGDPALEDVVSAAMKKAETIFTEEARKAKSEKTTLDTALKYLEQWLREDRFKEYREALLALIELAEEDKVAAKELYDSFWRIIPFGTGGRRWRMGIGPNRMNAYMVAMTAQGHSEYLKQQYPDEIKRGDVCIGAWDVRAFKKFFAEIPSLRKYREIIEAKCPVLRELSSEDISKTAGLVYAGNGIKYLHPAEMRETPWLSFVINRFSGIVKKKPFSESTRAGRFLNRIANVVSGIVLSSSHNPYDNNGTKFYEDSGAQAPPQIVQRLMDIGDEVKVINYYAEDILNEQGRNAAFEKAVEDGQIIVLEDENLKILDEAYFASVIEEIKSVYTPEEWERLEPWFKKLYVSVNFLNGTGFTGLLPILEKLKFNVLRSKGDVPSWEFTEGYSNIPNPEAEKSFNTAMQIGVRRTLNWVFNSSITEIKSIIDEDGVEIPLRTLEAEHKGAFKDTDEVLGHVMQTRSKFVRGLVLDVNEKNEKDIRAFSVLNNICLLTDPDADRVGLGMVKTERTENGMRVHWVSGNDNDEAGIILFRYRLEKLREMAKRGELIKYIEKSREESGKAPSETGAYQLIMVNTVVSNPLEIVIAEKLSEEISELTGGKVTVKMITHHVGYKFTGEIIDNINKGVFNGIPGVLMEKAGVNLDEAFFVMSSEEGEGSLIGYRGSIDKDSGTTSLALAVLTAEQLSKGKTMYDYLMETYKIYGYSKTYLEPMVMTAEYGFNMINGKIMKRLREDLIQKVQRGEEVMWGRFKLAKGYDHYHLVRQMPAIVEYMEGLKSSPEKLESALVDVEIEQPWEKRRVARVREEPWTLSIWDDFLWPQAIREAVNIIEFDLELPSGEKIKIVLRPSGTEPKHKNVVTVVGLPLGENENLEEYIERINALNREVMDEVMIACYKFSEAEYDSLIKEQPGKYKIANLNPQDLRELLRIFPIIVPCETKLAIYFPLRDYVIQVSGRLAELATAEEFNKEYAEIRSKIEKYLVNFKEENGVDFIEESLILSLRNQINTLPVVDLNDKKVKAIYIQSILWFGKEIGERHFVNLMNEVKNIDKQDIKRAIESWNLKDETEAFLDNLAVPVIELAAKTFADSIVASVIVLARNAHKQDQSLIVGLETDWIPGYEPGKLQHGAINSLIQEIDSIENKLRRMGYKNIRFIHKKASELAGAIEKEAADAGTDYSNVVVLASKDTIGSKEFNLLRSTSGKKGAVLASVDPVELIEFYSKHAEDSSNQLYIKIMLMLTLALDVACGKAIPDFSIVASYNEELRKIEFLPRAEPKDYRELQERYKAERRALEAA